MTAESFHRIVVVDDESHGVDLLLRTLRRLGDVRGAGSADEGWELVQSFDPHLVISDQRMPGRSGVDLLAQVAREREHTGRVLLTGYADLEATIDAINEGRVHAYLTKPCEPDAVQATARSVLEQVRLARENARLLDDLSGKNRELADALRALRETQQRMLDAERLAAIGRMIAMIAHDLRGPLSVLHASGTCLAREGASLAPDSLGEIGGEVLAEVERMQRMCSELLDVTRASAGEAKLEVEELDDVVESALAPIAHEVAKAAVRLELDLRSKARVALDEHRLRRALLNLAYNAIEAMSDGGILCIATRREGDAAVLSVVDNGPGIPDEIRDRLFDPFVTVGKPEGSGLGLAVVKKVVDDHGGSIEVGKAEGGGTAFHVRLPLASAGTP